jgi:hypothetical protein
MVVQIKAGLVSDSELIAACPPISMTPVLGYTIIHGDYSLAMGGLAIASASDW